jgi:hypothetical protein
MSITVRILLRYLAMVLVTRGLMGADDASVFSTDPDVQMAVEAGIGFAIAGATELWHWASAKLGLYKEQV